MLVHGVAEGEVATTLGLTREQSLAKRAQMLARLDGRRPLAAA